MRPIKFRGYSKDFHENRWFYGNLIDKGNGSFQILEKNPKIWDLSYDGITVIPESIGQFTGLYDKNGKEIYEGDVLKTFPIISSDKIACDSFNVSVKFINSSWIANGILGKRQAEISEVIGNIYTNHELLTD